jgi:hypothetical protein
MTEPTRDWRIRETDADWECDWQGAERFHIRFFRALPMQEKLEAVEEMCRFVEQFRGGAARLADPGSRAQRSVGPNVATGR